MYYLPSVHNNISFGDKIYTDRSHYGTTADKVNTVVITYLDDYHFKFHELISNNHSSTVNNDLTSTFQKEIRYANKP